jgi:AhpD family alkylhydroperoxidase
MKRMTKLFIHAILVCAFAIVSQPAMAQTDLYEETKADIVETFGMVPTFMKAFPKHALPGAWKSMKALMGPEGKIESKNRQLIQLAVAAQIPCQYCVYFHKESAKASGATEEEIREAIALAADTRQWSTVLNGNQIDFDKFKMEFDNMMDYMVEKNKEN